MPAYNKHYCLLWLGSESSCERIACLELRTTVSLLAIVVQVSGRRSLRRKAVPRSGIARIKQGVLNNTRNPSPNKRYPTVLN
uniref:Uncharacterized protein n=1 Tax=Vibrio sp. F12 FF_152 TaxID=1652829 RepID=A0A0H3ZM30_9VIBR|nr:hypothetical protein [Vibrio sp. F12 FF_152]